MMRKIPDSWTTVPLEDVVRHTKGKKPKFLNPIPTKGFVPYIDIKAFEFGEIRETMRYCQELCMKDQAAIRDSSMPLINFTPLITSARRCG